MQFIYAIPLIVLAGSSFAAANDTVNRGTAANDLALLYHHQGDFALAEKSYLTALSIFRRSNDRSMCRLTAENLASLYLEIGQASKAESLLRPFLPDDTNASAIDAEDAVLLSDLGSVRVHQNRFADAERLFQAVIRSLEDRHDAGSSETRANAMSNLGEAFFRTGNVSEAEVWSRRALNIFETLPREYAGNLVRVLANLAMITAFSGESSESAELFRRAIATCESALGPEHPLLGEILARYAVILRRMKRNAEARRIEAQAKQIQTRSRHENLLGYTVEASALANKKKAP